MSELTYKEVLAIVMKDLKDRKSNNSEIADYASQNKLPLGWVQMGYEKLNPITMNQLKQEIKKLKKRQDKLHKIVTSRIQATTREANLGKIQQVIDEKMEQLRKIKEIF